MYGVRLFCGIHIVYSGARVFPTLQGLYLYGKSVVGEQRTHLLFAGSPNAICGTGGYTFEKVQARHLPRLFFL